MDKFDDLMRKRIKRNGLFDSLEAARIVFIANVNSEGFRAIKFKNKTLYCEVENPNNMIYLRMKHNQIMQKINKKLNKQLIEKIIFRLKREN